MGGLQVCGVALLLIVGPAVLMLWWRDKAREARGFEMRDYGTGYGQPSALEDTKHQPLWERLESGSKRREGKVIGLFVLAFFILPALIMLLGRAAGIDSELLGYTALLVGMLIFFGPGTFLHRDNETDADALGAQQVSPGSLPEVERALTDMVSATGVVKPDLYLVETEAANACVFAGGQVCVTRGILTLLDPREYAAVFAWLLARQFDPDQVGMNVNAFASDGAEITDAEALRLLRDPLTMLSAWKKILAADNEMPGSLKLPAARFLVPPGQTAAWRRDRIEQLTELGGAVAVDAAPLGVAPAEGGEPA